MIGGFGGFLQLAIDLVRIPDVSFISWDSVPGGELSDEPVPLLVPDLAVEVRDGRIYGVASSLHLGP